MIEILLVLILILVIYNSKLWKEGEWGGRTKIGDKWILWTMKKKRDKERENELSQKF
tara:strand:- start:32153 stop:32323 length:171 start_codon:yes stop_codon:yes gene_type:complete